MYTIRQRAPSRMTKGAVAEIPLAAGAIGIGTREKRSNGPSAPLPIAKPENSV